MNLEGSGINKINIETLTVEITRKCNNNCVYCYQQHASREDVGIGILKQSIIEFRKKGVKYIEFSGGEPTLSSHLPELIQLARNEKYENITLLTNGRRLSYEKYLDTLMNRGLKTVIFSIPAFDATNYRKITKTKKSDFSQVIAALGNTKKYKNIETGAVTVIHKQNYRNLNDIVKNLSKLQLNFITLCYIAPYVEPVSSNGKNNFQNFIPAYAQAIPYLKTTLKKYGSKAKICVDGIPRCCIKGYEDFITNEEFTRDSYVLDPQGNMYRRLEALELISAKAERCIGCKYADRCLGFFVSPLKKYGLTYKDIDFGKQKVALDIQSGPCAYKCVFCTRQINGIPFYKLEEKKDKAEVDWDKLDLFFKNSVEVSLRLDIWGRERVDEFKGIHKVLKMAKASGFKNIVLWSSGLRFNSKQRVKKFINNGVTGFEMPIYGYNEKVHNSITRISGAFNRLMASLTTLDRFDNIYIGLHTVVLKQNYLYLPGLIKLIAVKFKNVKLSIWLYYPEPDFNQISKNVYRKNCPSFTEIIAAFEKYAGNPIKFKVASVFMPLCIVLRLKKYIVNITPLRIGPARLLVFNRYSPYSSYKFLSGKQEFDSVFTSRCVTCRMKYKCGGVFKDYLAIYGDKELIPITGKNLN